MGRAVPLPLVIALVIAALVGGYLAGRPGYPSDTSAEAGFLRDMSTHHAQAVDMSMLVLEETDDSTLSALAYDIARTQQSQIGRMKGWLKEWELPVRPSRSPMAWMAEGEPPERMPGLATEEEMAELRQAEGKRAEVLFLELMIAHHEGGVDMAEAAVERAEHPNVVDLADGMIVAQRSENELMRDLLAERAPQE